MTVHILRGGRTLCGWVQAPLQWPRGHRWVSENHSDEATCPDCLDHRDPERDTYDLYEKAQLDKLDAIKNGDYDQ